MPAVVVVGYVMQAEKSSPPALFRHAIRLPARQASQPPPPAKLEHMNQMGLQFAAAPATVGAGWCLQSVS